MSIPKVIALSVISAAVLLCSNARGQDAPNQSQENIRQLIDGLEQAVVGGSPVDRFFSPNARRNERTKIQALQAQPFISFQIVGYTLKDLEFSDPQHASLPATIKWSTRNQETSTTATLRFVREQGAWYFEQADFWQVSSLWLLFPLLAISVAYACGAVGMYWHSNRQQWASPKKRVAWGALAIVPFAPFFYFARKPWTIS
jgi:hypothetical protein